MRGAPSKSAEQDNLRMKIGEGWRAFERAGWRAVDATASEARREGARILIGPDGDLSLSEQVVSVRFRPDATDERVAELLRRVRGRKIEELPFAPNMFRVRIEPDGGFDAFDAAEALSVESECLSAEVELLQELSGR